MTKIKTKTYFPNETTEWVNKKAMRIAGEYDRKKQKNKSINIMTGNNRQLRKKLYYQSHKENNG